MKVINWVGAAASVVVMAGCGGAFAADLAPLYDEPFIQDVPEMQPVEIGTGWYLRGDVGYQFKSDLKTDLAVASPLGSLSGGYDGLELPAAASASGGMGYKFNEFLRADTTIGYWKSDVEGADFSGGGVSFDTDVQAFELMANAYVDLGTYAGFTPYLGAGAGGVHVSYDMSCHYAGFDCEDTFAGLDIQKGSGWRFAYALMAGMSYDVSQNLKFDVGYRFTDVDGGSVGSVSGIDALTGATLSASATDDGFQRHTVQAGVRYSLW